MKKAFFVLFCLSAFTLGRAQLKVFAKFTPETGPALVDESYNDPAHKGEIPLTTYSDNDEQTLAIGGQPGGGGAGKVSFNPTSFSKPAGANSSRFFQMMAKGTTFKFVEFNFYNSSDELVYRVTLKMVGIKSIQNAAASCTGGCPGIIENFSVEYGAKVITAYEMTREGTPGKAYTFGWNRVTNIEDNDPTKAIK